MLNTSFIERLIATFRSRLALLVRRTRHLARKESKVQAAVYLVGTVYNILHLWHPVQGFAVVGSGPARLGPGGPQGLEESPWRIA